MGLCWALAIAGCSHVEPQTGPQGAADSRSAPQQAGRNIPTTADHVITIYHTRIFDADSFDTNRINGLQTSWVLLDENQGGAVQGMKVYTNNVIEWSLHGKKRSFSITVRDTNDWTVCYGDSSNTDASRWRTNAPPPFNAAYYGVIDSATDAKTNMIVQLRFTAKGTNRKERQVPYQIAIGTIHTSGMRSSTSTNDDSTVDATLVWDGQSIER